MGGARPSTPIRGDGIPAALKAHPHWLVWRWEFREDKWTKPPYEARTGRKARSNDPTTWCAYEDALAVLADYDGLGYVLSGDDPFVGVDLDHAIDDAGYIAPWAQTIVDALSSYTEISPSGTGLRIILEATLPPGGRKHDDIEVYATGRYLTITGAHVDGTPRTVEQRTTELAAFHAKYFPPPAPPIAVPTNPRPTSSLVLEDAALVARILGSRHSARFDRLWNGNLADANGDHSKADLQLCGILAFWTQRDATRIDHLFRQSGLMRKKWDESHFSDGRTYGQATLAKAIAECREVYEPKPATTTEPVTLPLREWNDILDAPIEVPEYLWPGWAVNSKLYLIAGAGDSMKSWMTMYVGLAVASGRPALDIVPCLKGGVLLVSAENGFDEDKRRLKLLARGLNLPRDLPVTLLPADAVSLRDPRTLEMFFGLVKERTPNLVVIDSAIALAELENENDNAEVQRFMREVVLPLCRTHGVTVFLIVHSPKAPTQKGIVLTDEHVARGASAWRNACDGILYLKRDKTLGAEAVILRQAKVRIGKRRAAIWFSIEDTEIDAHQNSLGVQIKLGGTVDDAAQADSTALAGAVDAVMNLLREAAPNPIHTPDLLAALTDLKVTKSTARRALEVVLGKHPWPHGAHAGKTEAVAEKGRDGRKTTLRWSDVQFIPDPEDEENEAGF